MLAHSANVVWMIREFYFADGTRTEARVFFWAGLLILGGWYVVAGARRRVRARP